MQYLLFDVSLLCDFSQIRCRIDVPLRAIRINLPDTEVQVLPGRPCPRVTGTAELLACLYRICLLYTSPSPRDCS